MYKRKIVLNISEMNFPKDIEEYLCSQLFIYEDSFIKIDNVFFDDIDLDYEDNEAYKILFDKIQELEIDFAEEEYILLTFGDLENE